MISFKIKADLRSPVVVGNRTPNLAGLLHHCCFLHTGDEAAATKMLEGLIESTDGVYHASDMLFGVDLNSPLIATNLSTVGVMNENDLTSEHIKPTDRKGVGYNKVQLEGGPYKARLDHNKSYMAKSAVFYCKGDMKKILSLLEHYVFNIGMYANMGFGNLAEWTTETLIEDFSFLAPSVSEPQIKVQVNRIPVKSQLAKGISGDIQACSLRPPYYRAQPQVNCFVGEKINKTLDI